MKWIRVIGLADNSAKKEDIVGHFVELELYEEKPIAKEHDILAEHSFDALQLAARDLANSLWIAVKSIGRLLSWSVIAIVESLKWLWKSAFKK